MKLNQYEWDPTADHLGEGAFADVFKATDHSGDAVALKIYRESVIKSSTGGSSRGKYSLENEFSKGKLLSHTNIIRYIGLDYIVHTDAMGREVSYPVLIMEYADAGSLENRIRRAYPNEGDAGLTTENLNTAEAVKIADELFCGLAYLHSQGIVHRDIKPANILFKTDRTGRPVVKITDFGISRDTLAQNMAETSTGNIGSGSYMAPEQYLPKTYGLDEKISNRTDIWAAGVILYRMFTGNLPFKTQEDITGKEPDYSRVPARYQPLIKGCLQKHAVKRLADANVALRMLKEEPQQKKKELPVIDKKIIIAICAGLLFAVIFGVWYHNRHRHDTNGSTTGSDTTATIKKDTTPFTRVEPPKPAKFEFADDFSNNVNGWPLDTTSHRIKSINEGKLIIQGLSADFSYRVGKPFDVDLDKDYSVTATCKWMDGSTSESFGIEYASDTTTNSYCRFNISADGSYKICWNENNGDWKDIRVWTKSSFINTNSGLNILQVKREGDNIIYSINYNVVERMHLNRSLGNYFGVSSSGVSTVTFDDFKITGTSKTKM